MAITTGSVPKLGAFGPMTSAYCRDPDSNLIEVATYLPRP
jgi:catechol 2,3-dioxygenase-like lactoylglutathione lyase family enzyme